MIKKLFSVIACTAICLTCLPLTACGNENVLKIYNCYDYILDEDDDSLIQDFEKYYKEVTGEKITVEYSCFDTPEDAYNNLKISPDAYDLICPSDYMIEKMARENMLQKFTMDEDGEYRKNISPYIDKVFKSVSWGDGESLYDYAAGYMWGTLGLVYNPQNVDSEDMQSWSSLWDLKYKGKFSIKDSVRDTYFICLAKYYNSGLLSAKTTYESNKDLSAYQSLLKDYFNDTKSQTVSAVKAELMSLAKNCKNLEVDEGKSDIIDGKIDINFAWSGDAVYALDTADENGLTLEYYVPDEGSNVWFDGWVIPKKSNKVDAAKMFIDFISNPKNVVRNMEYIGYTSVICGDEVFNYAVENYDEDEGKEVDLSYFFGEGDYVIKTTKERRQLYTQYPTEDVINRCAVMSYFQTDANNNINEMWIAVKNSLK